MAKPLPMIYRSVLALMLSFVAVPALAQFYHNHHFVHYDDLPEGMQMLTKRAAVGIQYPSMTMQTDNSFTQKSPDPNTALPATSFKLQQRSGFGIGISFGSFFKLKEFLQTGNMIALNYELGANYCKWNFKQLKSISPYAEEKASIIHYALPVSLMYKHGVDAELDKELKYMYSFGLGVEPSRVETRYFQLGGSKILIRPFVVAEAGFFAGTGWKLRASYYPLSNVYYDATAPGGDGMMKLKMTGSSTVIVSLIIMTGVKHWNE